MALTGETHISVRAKPSRHREQKLKKRYGLTEEQYNAILTEQEGKCGICRRYRKLSVDHDHKTGKNRGLLCSNCNSGLGLFEENLNVLNCAKVYLTKHKGGS